MSHVPVTITRWKPEVRTLLMQFTIEVGRYNSEGIYADTAVPGRSFPPPWDKSPERRYQTYTVELPEHAVVLDALIAIREYQDPSLAVRCACRSAICGSCAMWINGHANLACKSKLAEFTKDGKTRVESPPSMPIIRDLVCDMTPFWEKHLAVQAVAGEQTADSAARRKSIAFRTPRWRS